MQDIAQLRAAYPMLWHDRRTLAPEFSGASWQGTMKQLQPVIWSKGTFLTPQHLQMQDRYIEDTLQFQMAAVEFRPWGFQQVQIDHQALAEGRFSATRVSGIFPDGLSFDAPESDSVPPVKSLAEAFGPDQQSIDVYLAVPGYRYNGVNVSSTRRDGNTRWISDIAMLRDENTGLSEKPVQVGRKNLRWLLESESREGSTAMRVARVQRTAAGSFAADVNFVPPLLNIRASDHVLGVARGLAEVLAAKIAILGGARRQRNQNLADFGVSDIANFWLLYTMNSHFPQMRDFAERQAGHPEQLYSLMLSLAGALTTFSARIEPRDLPEYDHEDLGACFTKLDEKLRLLLKTIVPSNFLSLPLHQVRPSIYAVDIPDDSYLENTRIYLAVSADLNEADLISKAPDLMKVCSATHIDHLVRQALRGAKLTHVATPPSAVPVKLKYKYFSVNQSGPAWEAVRRVRNLAVYVPGEFPNPQIEAIFLLPNDSQQQAA